MQPTWTDGQVKTNPQVSSVVGRNFISIEGLRFAVIEFPERYNEIWLIARHSYQTPAHVRSARLPAELPLIA
jgi:hypothetical protein